MNRVRRALTAGAQIALLAAAGTACTPGASDSSPTIVVTTNILGDVVENVVGDGGEVLTLMEPNADPHSFGISARQAGEMESADLIVANGLGLEEGLQAHLENARTEGVPVLEVGEHIDPLQYGEGESAGRPDPHFWTDPARMITAVDAVVSALDQAGDLDEEIRAGAGAYRAQLEDLDAEITTTLEAIPPERRKLVTNHHVFGYLADRYGFEVIGAVLPSGTTLASPSAADLRDLSEAITEAGVPAIFADSSQPQRLAEVLAEETGLDVEVVPLYSESLTEPDDEAGTYIDMQRINATRMAEALTRNP